MVSLGPRYAIIFIFTSRGMSNREASLLRDRNWVNFTTSSFSPGVAVLGFATIVRFEETMAELLTKFDRTLKLSYFPQDEKWSTGCIVGNVKIVGDIHKGLGVIAKIRVSWEISGRLCPRPYYCEMTAAIDYPQGY
jgi:hypothetical protein